MKRDVLKRVGRPNCLKQGTSTNEVSRWMGR